MENQFKGTKGKWTVAPTLATSTNGEPLYYNIEVGDQCFISTNANIYIGVDHEKQLANALLISKAPEMLEMLKNSNSVLSAVLELFGNDMAFSTRFGVTSQIKENEELIKSATTL